MADNLPSLTPLPSRLPDWRSRMVAYMAAQSRAKFQPGRHDCALFVAGAVQAMTGHDPARAYRGRYVRLGAGRAMLRAAGFEDHLAYVAELLPEVPPSLAQVGDVAVMETDMENDAGALGVVQGSGVYVLTPDGLAVANRLAVKRAFRV